MLVELEGNLAVSRSGAKRWDEDPVQYNCKRGLHVKIGCRPANS
jgi:hypothetical protein